MASRVIEIEQLGKRYRLGERTARYLTLREALATSIRRGADGRRSARKDLWALRDINFTVSEGEVVGVIGRNGAGKSTLLKILARITEPTEGVARVRGRVGALLEVGTGFHPELTGTENIYLNGAILGLSRREIRRRFDAIVSFAGVEQFLDTPLKRYSSGMYLRLAFAVAAHVEPDIVVVDEVLAVGDADFQSKCLGKMSDFGAEGRTVVFVSHDLGAITRLCERTLWIDGGRIRAEGPSADVVERYLAAVITRAPRAEFESEPDAPAQLREVAVTDEHGDALELVRRDNAFAIRVRFIVRERIPDLDAAIFIRSRHGVDILSEAWSDTGERLGRAQLPQEVELTMTVPPILAPGDYVLAVWLGTEHGDFFNRDVLTFHVSPSPDDVQGALERRRLVAPRVTWRASSPDDLPR